MRKVISIILLFSMLLTGGCVEMRQTARMLTITFVELLRLPIYCMRLPFQILQGMGPIIQSAVRSAAQVAPLLLLIERRAPKDSLYAAKDAEEGVESMIEKALSASAPTPLLPLLEGELKGEDSIRFALVDAELMRDVQARRGFLDCFADGRGDVRCIMVDGGAIFTQRDRFLEICRLMSLRGDSLFALTRFNSQLAELADTTVDSLPPDTRDRSRIKKWDRWVEEADRELHDRG